MENLKKNGTISVIDSSGVTLPTPQNTCCQKKYFKSNYFQLISLLLNCSFCRSVSIAAVCSLYSAFANKYQHCVDSDKILACETFVVAKKTAMKLLDNQNSQTLKTDDFVESLSVDSNQNIFVEFEVKGHKHKIMVNAKLSSRGNFTIK